MNLTLPTTASSYAAGPTTKAPPWHNLVVFDLLFNNLATGLFLVAALGELARPDLLRSAAAVAYPVALLLLLVDLLLLVLDLGDRLRFHHMLRVFKPSSPMSLGTWCLTIFSLPLTGIVGVEILLWLDLLPRDWVLFERLRLLVVVAAIPAAVGSAVYKGVLFSTSSQPGWKNARWLGGYLANSALMLGCAEMLTLAVVFGYYNAATALAPALLLLLVLNLFPLGFLLIELDPTAAEHYSSSRRGGAYALVILLGTAAPFCLILLSGSLYFVGAAALLILLVSYAIRHAIVFLPHMFAAYG